MRPTRVLGIGIILLAVGLARLGAPADDFRNQTVRIVVGYSEGGSFDAYSRLIARYLGTHLPGRPSVVVQDMPGQGGVVAANYIYNEAKPDGLTIATFASPIVIDAALGVEAIRFDPRRLAWVGVPAPYDTVCMLNSSTGIQSVAEWLASKRPIKLAGIGTGTSTSDLPRLARAATGLPLQVVDGYQSGTAARRAAENGEAEGYCGSWQGIRAIGRSEPGISKLHPVLQLTVSPHHSLFGVPVVVSYAKNEALRQVLVLADRIHRAQFLYAMPPATPFARVRLFQEVFVRTLRDPVLQAEAARLEPGGRADRWGQHRPGRGSPLQQRPADPEPAPGDPLYASLIASGGGDADAPPPRPHQERRQSRRGSARSR